MILEYKKDGQWVRVSPWEVLRVIMSSCPCNWKSRVAVIAFIILWVFVGLLIGGEF